MARTNLAKAAAAQLQIVAGAWTIDSDNGYVVSRKTGKRIGAIYASGYVYVGHRSNGKQYHSCVHRVIWEYINGPIVQGDEINHKNGIKSDNRINNLELLSASDNVTHAHKLGLCKGQAVGNAIYSDIEIAEVHRLKGEGLTQHAIAERTGISRGHVSKVLLGISRTEPLTQSPPRAHMAGSSFRSQS